MSDQDTPEGEEAAPAAVAVRKRRRVSIVWLVPILAAVVAGGLWLQTLRARGPLVTVVFDDGSSLEAGKTKVLFEGVEVGRVETVGLSGNLETVICTIRLDSSAARMAREGAEYWVVRPSIGIGGISGLETLVSGSYIGVVPGDGKPKMNFEAVGQPPMSTTRIPGLQLVLEADGLGSVEVGSPVAFRQIQVGEVTGYSLREDLTGVDLTVVIYQRHQSLVNAGSRFFNASGLEVSLGAAGLKLDMQSVAALLLGGISFETPAGESKAVADGASFRLHADHASIVRERRLREGLTVVLESGALGSIKRGDPVSYREVQVGEVIEDELGPNSTRVHVKVNIWPEYAALVRDNSVFWNASGLKAHFGLLSGLDVSVNSVESLLAGGVAFATPTEAGERVESGWVFPIGKKPDDFSDWRPRIVRAVGDVVRVPGKVLRAGAREVRDHLPGEAPAEESPAAAAPAGESQRHQRHGPRHGF